MKINGLQIYGLPKNLESITKILNSTGIEGIEYNITNIEEITLFNERFASLKVQGIGVHCNLSIYEQLKSFQRDGLKELALGKLIVPAAVEENSLCWPWSFLRRFPRPYQGLKNLVDLVKDKSLRKVVAGESLKGMSYFSSDFWIRFAQKLNNLKNEGFVVGFHNHGFEFKKLDQGKNAYEILDSILESEVFFQFDITNSLISGEDPIRLMKKFEKRIKSFHLRIEDVGNEHFYQKMFSQHFEIFKNKELVIELKEADLESVISRVKWWQNLIESVS